MTSEELERRRRVLDLARERDRVDDATRERLYQQGYATAYKELLDGNAGYFFTCANGTFFTGFDKDTGLPIYSTGDVGCTAIDVWKHGFETATRDFVKQVGLPWNSHLGFIHELADIESYFKKRSLVEAPLCLRMGEPPDAGPEPGLTIQLINDSSQRAFCGEPHIRLTFQHLYCGIFRWLPGGSSTETTDKTVFAEQKRAPAKPRLTAGTTDIYLRFYASAKQINFFWGPPASRLCFFRFDEAAGLTRQTGPKTEYAALDLCLADWIPSYVQGLTKEYWQK